MGNDQVKAARKEEIVIMLRPNLVPLGKKNIYDITISFIDQYLGYFNFYFTHQVKGKLQLLSCKLIYFEFYIYNLSTFDFHSIT